MVLSLLTMVSSITYAYDFEVDGLYYRIISDNQVEITYKELYDHSYSGQLEIPEKVKNDDISYDVVAVGSYAFYYCTEITGSLNLPNSINSIGDHAFHGCNNLTGNLTIPNSVTTIGISAFNDCSSFTGPLMIPESVNTIGDLAFANCGGLTGSLEIPESITSISGCVFSGCSGLTGSLIIPNTVTEIGYGAFMNCGFTGNLVIPNSVKSIHGYAFFGCSSFTGQLVIPTTITSIEESTFGYCEGFSGMLTIPDNITTIGKGAFYNCNGLDEKLTIPNSIKSIGNNAFLNCSSLTLVESQIESPHNIDNTVFRGIGNPARLVVPMGTKNKYSELSGWTANFKEIVEIGETPIYSLSITSSGNGATMFDGNEIRNTSQEYQINSGSSVSLTFYPDKGYKLGGVKVNDSKVFFLGESYTIEKIYTNTVIEVIFEELDKKEFVTINGINYQVKSYEDHLFTLDEGDYGTILDVPELLYYQGGEWKVVGINENALLSCKDLAAVIWNPREQFTATTINDNLLLYVKDEAYAPSDIKNVVVNGHAKSITLTDAQSRNNFYCPEAFTAESIVYSHGYSMKTGMNETRGWETISLPFDVQEISHSSKGEIVPFAKWSEVSEMKPFWLYELSGDGFIEAKEIKANTPYIISMPNNDLYEDSYKLSGRVLFSSRNVVVNKSEDLNKVVSGSKIFIPNFTEKDTNAGYYALNVNNDYSFNEGGGNEGSMFVLNLRKIHPFEAYMTSTSGTRTINVFDGATTAIRGIEEMVSSQQTIKVYDLSGRLIKTATNMETIKQELPIGVYIVNNKKMIIK